MKTYTKAEIFGFSKEILDKAEKFQEIHTKDLNPQEIVELAASAENLAQHAAHHDLPYIATNMLVIASRMNRYLSLHLAYTMV